MMETADENIKWCCFLRLILLLITHKGENSPNDHLLSVFVRGPTDVEARDTLLVDLAAPLLSPVDIGGPAFGSLQLLPCPRSLQLPLGHEIPRQAFLRVVCL